MLDVVKLATFRAVVRHGSFSAAGKALSLTQPAVSRQVAALEAQAGTQLVRRTQQGVIATEAGRLLLEHADAILGRVALAESQLAELAGLRRGHVRLGSFFTALVHLSSELGIRLEERHPELFAAQTEVIEDQLVDRATAFARLAGGEIDLAIVFRREHDADDVPEGVEIVELFRDPARVLLPSAHRLAGARAVALANLAEDTWIRPHRGGAARDHDDAMARAGLAPRVVLAGQGEEPVETQALVAAGRGVALASALNVVLDPRRVAVLPVRDALPGRRVQAALMHGHAAPATLAALEVLRQIAADAPAS